MANPFEHTLTVRYRDVDMFGHVNNAVYFTYMEQARIHFFYSLSHPSGDFRKEWPIIVAHASCDFKSAAFINETIVITVSVENIGNSSFTLAYEMKEKGSGRLVGLAKTVIVAYDYATKKVMIIPDEIRKKL